MPTPTTWSATTTAPKTGNVEIDGLLYGTKWVGSTVTYSFPTLNSYWSTDVNSGYGPSSDSGEPWVDYDILTSSDIGAVIRCLTTWVRYCNLKFVETADNATVVGDLRFAYSYLGDNAQAWAYYPEAGAWSGDVWFNTDSSSYTDSWIAGSYEYLTVIHEIGHALGLKHPDSTGNGSVALPATLDSRSFTVMSYAALAGNIDTYFNFEPTTPMVLDIAAIQTLYGSNLGFNSGNTTYTFTGSGTYHQTIWDAGGIDNIAYNASTGGIIDLRSGTDAGSRLGTAIQIFDLNGALLGTVNNIWIANGTIIENATGGSGADTLIGNAADNVLNGGGGADFLVGGLGNDTYVVDSLADVVSENPGEGTDLVKVVAAGSGTYSLAAHVEKAVLLNAVAFNLTGNAEANTLTGNDFANTLDGGLGADFLSGGLGNDTYVVDEAGDVLADTGGIDTVRSALSWSLAAGFENLVLTGSADLNGSGNGLANSLTGNDGANTLIGGLGNDTYEVGAGDVIVESSALATEIDSVRSSVSWSLGANLENLTLIGSANLDATGNGLANVLVGNSGNNTLDGGLAIDVLKGAAGDDTYWIDLTAANLLQDGIVENLNEGSDAVILRGGNAALATYTALTLGANVESLDASGTTTAKLNLTGNGLANTLIGNAADNVLNGGGGADSLVGGLGNDTYVVDSLADVVSENPGEGTDLVKVVAAGSGTYSLAAHVEKAVLLNAVAFNLTGNAEANTLTGNDFANTLDGGLGADFLSGGLGNDTYVVDEAGDVLADTGGIDTVRSAVSWSLAAGFENLVLTGSADLNGSGNGLANSLTGNDGANTLIGGLGNDTYEVGAGDVIVESSALATEIDSVRSSVSWSLGANLENLTLIGSANLDATGNGLANVLVGNSGNNTLDGGLAIDVLKGAAGDDTYWIDLTAANLLQDGIVENLNEGSDAVILRGGNAALATYTALTLGANVESLDASGTTTAKLNLTGNGLANTLIGNAADNVLNGGGGADSLAGGLGNDTYVVDSLADVVSENPGEGTDLVKVVAAGSGTYSLAAHVEKAVLLNAVAFNLTGNAEANTLTGNDFANTLDGGLGADFLSGGLGNDTYVVDEAGDVLADTGGVDTVRSAVSWSLAAGFENLVLTGSADLNGSGNGLANSLTGNDGINTLIGGAGNDIYVLGTGDHAFELPGEGNDLVLAISDCASLDAAVENLVLYSPTALTATGNGLGNTMTGNTEDNTLKGGGGNDVLIGGLGNDLLDGGDGQDTMIGGLGDDIYVIDSIHDIVTEGVNGGHDSIEVAFSNYTLSGANIETLRLLGNADLIAFGSASNDTLIGNSGNNQLYGNGGNDLLIGGTGQDQLYGGGLTDFSGADTMLGGGGSDTYWYVTEATEIFESHGEGFDTAILAYTNTDAMAVTIDMNSHFLDIEQLSLHYSVGKFVVVGTSDGDIISGNAYASRLEGGYGADSLIGGGNGDTLAGGFDSDFYSVSSTSEVIVEAIGEGLLDRVTFTGNNISSVAVTLSYENIESIEVTGSGLFNLTANDLGNTLAGNDSANVITSGISGDWLIGRGGNDSFVFSAPLNETTNLDVIADFTAGDRIVLDHVIFEALSDGIQQSNIFSGAGATSASTSDQHLIYDSTTGSLYYDPDGLGGADACLFANLRVAEYETWNHPSSLSASDFAVV